MHFFKKRKKEKTLEKKFDELNDHVLTEWDKKRPQKVEQYVVEHLEQALQTAREIDDIKAEYRVVTSYLNDIQAIEELPEDERAALTEIAYNITSLNKARDEFLHTERKITDVQYMQMQQEEQNVPSAINRLKSNEAYRDTLNKDMKYLEREKEGWQLFKEDLIHEQKKLKNAVYIVIGLSVTAALVLLILQFILEIPMQLGWTILIFCAVAGVSLISLRLMNSKTEYKKAEASIKRAIVLLNQIKIKYVNITNAIDYSCEKFHVENAAELNTVWEYYLEAIKQREKFERNNDDLSYYTERLMRQLSKCKLYDTRIWITQAQALANHHEMVETTHELVERRQKLRDRIEQSAELTKSQIEDVEGMMRWVDEEMRQQFQEIIESIQKLASA